MEGLYSYSVLTELASASVDQASLEAPILRSDPVLGVNHLPRFNSIKKDHGRLHASLMIS